MTKGLIGCHCFSVKLAYLLALDLISSLLSKVYCSMAAAAFQWVWGKGVVQGDHAFVNVQLLPGLPSHVAGRRLHQHAVRVIYLGHFKHRLSQESQLSHLQYCSSS